jgi:N-acetylmuramoyl-L-alanine amidase
VNYQGRKKKLDLAARLAVANSTPDAIFISIHMNSFTDPRYSGLQVWYSPNNADSEPLAELIRAKNRELLQPQNSRTTKSATSAINLLHNASCPAVLVECGFLSNPDEAALFENDEYRQRVAFMLFCSIIEFLNTGNE